MLIFGTLLCVDIALEHLTFLPMRAMAALWSIFSVFVCKICPPLRRLLAPQPLIVAQWCHLLYGMLMVTGTAMLLHMDIATVYHDIRGQSVMKLYVIFNVLEVLERLCSSFGEDILDSLFSSITKGQGLVKILVMIFGAHVYILCHALVHFYFATTLSVALASGDNGALFSVLMASNFVELKGSVFKKFDPENLFQISCSDIVERFRLMVYVGVVIVQNTSYHKGIEWYNQMGQVSICLVSHIYG